MGNPEALASAYSLIQLFSIAADLGGEEAYQNLRDRAARYGIRLASDMVPIIWASTRPWVIEHPDWFLSLRLQPLSFLYIRWSGSLAGQPGWASSLKITIILAQTLPSSFKRVDKYSLVIRVISITAMTAPACPGTIPPN
jgi:hypothetical protein